MSRRVPAFLFLGAFLAFALQSAPGQATLDGVETPPPEVRIAAPLSTKSLLTATARVMNREKGIHVSVSANLTSLDALAALAGGKADIAFITRPLSGEDRAQYPDLNLVDVPIGMEVVAIGVSDDLWDAGIHTIRQQTMRDIYEQKITNWHQIGGPDEKITFFNLDQGEGVWEMFAEWLYGDNRRAPLPKTENVANTQDARDALEFTPGSIASLGAALVDGSRCHALGIDISGHVVTPTPAEVAAGTYPIVRPITAVVVGRPTLSIRAVTEYLTSPPGQALLRNIGALGLNAVPKPPSDSDY
jgi:phosphate transport system substrate-binding protein